MTARSDVAIESDGSDEGHGPVHTISIPEVVSSLHHFVVCCHTGQNVQHCDDSSAEQAGLFRLGKCEKLWERTQKETTRFFQIGSRELSWNVLALTRRMELKRTVGGVRTDLNSESAVLCDKSRAKLVKSEASAGKAGSVRSRSTLELHLRFSCKKLPHVVTEGDSLYWTKLWNIYLLPMVSFVQEYFSL